MGKSPYDITVPRMPGSGSPSGEETRSEPTVEAVVQFRVGKQWLRLAGFAGVPAAQGFRNTLVLNASASNGPDAAQYMRNHTRVAEITTISWTAVIPGR